MGRKLDGRIFWQAAKEFGFRGKENEVRLYVDFLKNAGRSKHMEHTQDQIRLANLERKEEEVRESTPGLNTHELPPDLAWIYTHPAMGRSENPKTGLVPVSDEDLKGAPNVGAANMLRFYSNHKDKFYDKILANFSKKQAAENEGETEDGVNTQEIKEIEAMLSEL